MCRYDSNGNVSNNKHNGCFLFNWEGNVVDNDNTVMIVTKHPGLLIVKLKYQWRYMFR